MFRFIHAADIHLDSPLRGLARYEGAPVEEIKQSTRRAFERLVALAIEQEVAFVLIAGDLYDGDWTDYNTGLFFGNEMKKLRDAGIRVFLIAGNHDAANKMTRELRLPDNVMMLSDEKPETVRLEDCSVAIHGQSFAQQAVENDLSEHYPMANKGYFNIGMLHTSIGDVEGHARYAPCKIEGLCAKQYNYWALGHVHNRSEIKSGDPWIVFSGNLQGRHIRETGHKGCYLVTVDDRHSTSVEFRRLDVFQWELCQISAGSAKNEDDVFEQVAETFRELRDNETNPMAVRIQLQAPDSALERLIADGQRCVNEMRGLAERDMWVEKVKLIPIQSSTPPGDGPMGELSAVLQELQDDDSSLTKMIEEISGVRQLIKRTEFEFRDSPDPFRCDDPTWLRELLTQVQPLLMQRLLHGRNE